MASQTENTDTTYVLDLLCDDDSCSLTTLINDVRFHIIVEPEELRKNSDKTFYYDYLDKISGLREAEQREEEELEIRESQGKTKRARDKDSAVALDDNEEGDDGDQCFGDAVVELRNWILGAFKDIAAVHAPADRTPEESTLHDWYHGPTYFYKLKVSQGCIEPQLLEENKAMTKKIEKLVPRLALPRYIQKMTLPWLNAKDLVVKSETASPEPAHPGEVVTKDGKRLFFKPVDSIQPDSFKREIKHLKQLEELDLDIKVPQLYGLVAFQNSKTEVMGLLLSVIKGATPLTHLLDQSVDPSLRKCWSDKVESYVAQLHEHDIIWGDAKADNFMVDKNDELWIIDFGGSYTEGWVDPELKETIEGDDMGVEKIQNALEDPESNTFDPTNSSTIRPSHARSSSSLFVTEKPRTDSKRKHDGEQNGHDNDTYKKVRRDHDGARMIEPADGLSDSEEDNVAGKGCGNIENTSTSTGEEIDSLFEETPAQQGGKVSDSQ